MNENVSREIQSDQEDVIDLGKLFYKILVRWRWFIISVPLCLAAALFYCLISTPVYDIHGKVMISDTKKGELGTNVMMKELGLGQVPHAERQRGGQGNLRGGRASCAHRVHHHRENG